MTRRSEAKAATRERIAQSAARLIRDRGLSAPNVAEVMADAGLTHGAFYAHFGSKDAMVAAGIAAGFADAASRLAYRSDGRSAQGRLARWIDDYLSPRHRDRLSSGCPLPALASEALRAGGEAQAAIASGANSLIAWLAANLRTARAAANEDNARSLAAQMLSDALGALILSRAIGQGHASDEILVTARQRLHRLIETCE